ncbi:DUF3958 family protein [Pueribacillus sp. YX66]|uniref:DUF3958 family protein n=1 Tax=Pueribacillus sp. YX66 TaxID=3229242 RepID=UPI00358D4766
MNEKMVELNDQLKNVSEEIFSVTKEKRKLLKVENELHSLSRQKDRLFQDLKQCWKHGEMSFAVQDTDQELKRRQRNIIQSLEDEITSLNKKTRALEEKASELRYKMRLLTEANDEEPH